MNNIEYDIQFEDEKLNNEFQKLTFSGKRKNLTLHDKKKNLSNNEYNDITSNIMNNFTREHRNKNGQFFTPYSLTKICIEKSKKYLNPLLKDVKSNINILEPSCGSLQFYDTLIKNITNSNIQLYEIDKKIVDLIKDKIRINDNLKCTDFLLDNSDVKFNYIIGNPPYYELSKEIKYKSKLIKGRYNIYALFVEKCINLLENNGLLCFIIPQTLMTSPSFSLTRDFIKSNCNILEIINLNNFSNDVSQDVNIYIFQKVDSKLLNNNYVMTNNLFSYTKNNENYDNMKKIKDISKVSGGTIVWNQCKDSLNNDGIGYRLVYSDDIGNIKSNKIKKNKEKGIYIETKKPSLTLPILFVARGSKIKYELITESKDNLIGENHVNVINGKLENLQKIIDNFNNIKLKTYITNILTTLNLSKTQLENIPIFE